MLRMTGHGPELTGPDGPNAWYLEVNEDEDPMEVVNRIASHQLGPPLLVHSTSWRRARHAVVLSFVVVLAEAQRSDLPGVSIGRAELARNSATAAAAVIATAQVVEHGLRHLAWLAREDEVVAGVLSPAWKELLSGYVPEPFRHLG